MSPDEDAITIRAHEKLRIRFLQLPKYGSMVKLSDVLAQLHHTEITDAKPQRKPRK
jgi:hypothetical protein